MFGKKIFKTLDVNQKTLKAVKNSNIDMIEILTNSTRDVMKLTKLSSREAAQLQLVTARSIEGIISLTALQILENNSPNVIKRKKLSIGCEKIDSFLGGGFMSDMLTEISGESASGKTQICLQLSLMTQLSSQWGGLDGCVVYVCTEDVFPSARLVEMINKLKARVKEFDGINFMDNIFIEHAAEPNDLENCLRKILLLITSKNIKLLVVDSVAACFQGDMAGVEGHQMFERSKKLLTVCGLLHKISSTFNMHVVLVNQVVDDFKESIWRPCETMQLGQSSTNRKIPALGLLWANEMNIRINISRTKEFVTIPKLKSNNVNSLNDAKIETYEANIRSMQVLSAPHLPSNMHCAFIVDEEGVKGHS